MLTNKQLRERAEIDRAYLEYLTDLAWDNEKTPSPSRAANAIGHNQKALDRSLGRLIKAGEIEVEKNGDKRRFVIVKVDIALDWATQPRRRATGPIRGRKVQTGSTRLCLTCQNGFISEGKHHRICDGCKATDLFNSASMADYMGATEGNRQNGRMISSYQG